MMKNFAVADVGNRCYRGKSCKGTITQSVGVGSSLTMFPVSNKESSMCQLRGSVIPGHNVEGVTCTEFSLADLRHPGSHRLGRMRKGQRLKTNKTGH